MAMRELAPSAFGLHLPASAGGCHRDSACCGRGLSLATTRRPFLGGSIRCVRELAPGERDLPQPQATESPLSGLEKTVDELWKEFFKDPSQWWDNRWEKGKSKYPDFTHKTTKAALWIDSKLTPAWVEAELTGMAPGSLQLNIFAWNKRLMKHVKAKQYRKVLDLFQQVQREGINPDKFTFVPVLNACAGLRALEEGKRAHAQVVQSGFERDEFVGSSLVNMYAKCGRIEDAWTVFKKTVGHDVVTWTTLILGFVKCGQGKRALELFRQMQQEGVEPNRFTFVAALNACASTASLEEGKKIHLQVIDSRCETDIFVGSSLVDMYAKCGSAENAAMVFNKMPSHNVVTWNAMIMAHAKCGQGKRALELYERMQKEGWQPQSITFVGALNACASLAALREGKLIHEHIIQSGCESNVFVGNSLIDMYVKCGNLGEAWKVFTRMPAHNVIAWSIIIQGYAKSGQGEKALELFQQMQAEGVDPDPVTFVAALNACACASLLKEGRRIHEQIIRSGCESDIYIGSSLVDMYAKCGSIDEAFAIFDKMRKRDVVTWGAMILGFVNCGQGRKALEMSRHMREDGIESNRFTVLAVLKACASAADIDEGRRVHREIIRGGWESDLYVGSSLVDMYAKCDSIEDAWKVFNKMSHRDVISWTTMILGCLKCGQGRKALELSRQMEAEGLNPQPAIFVGLIRMCATQASLEDGRGVHEQVIRHGLESDVAVGNSLIDMYSKCGSMEDAARVFTKMPSRDVVAWSSLILGYVRSGEARRALDLAREMEAEEGVEPNCFTFVAILNACGNLGDLEEGRRVHEQLKERGIGSDVFLTTSLIDMYAKCDNIDEARRVFDSTSSVNMGVWNAMIMGHLRCKQWEAVIELSHRMQKAGISQDYITYMAVLNACAGSGELQQGRIVHRQIIDSGFESDTHVTCSLIDMYGKCGSIEEAWMVFDKIPSRDVISYNAMVRAYVSSGQRHKALELLQQMKEEGMVSESAHELLSPGPRIPSLAALDCYHQANEGVDPEQQPVEVLNGGSRMKAA